MKLSLSFNFGKKEMIDDSPAASLNFSMAGRVGFSEPTDQALSFEQAQ